MRSPKPFQSNLVSEQEDPREVRHWRAQERDIIFMLSPCVSTPWLPEPNSWEWDVKGTKGEEKKGIDRGPDTGPCLQTPRSDRYSLPGQWSILSRYLFTKPSHRKTIESNHEESDRRVSKRFFLGFWDDGFFNRHWTIFWKILQFGLYWWFYLLSMYYRLRISLFKEFWLPNRI